MRIAVDMHFLQGKHQGIKTVLWGLYEALCNQSIQHDYLFVFLEPDEISEYWRRYGCVTFTGRMGRTARLAYGMAKAINSAGGSDLSHFTGVVPLGVSGRVLLTVHDMLFVTHPEFFHRSFCVKQRLAAAWSMRRADVVALGSRYTQSEVARLYPRHAKKFRLLRNGVTENNHVINIDEAKSIVKRNYGVEQYILTVGRIDPRKNHEHMLEAYRILAHNISPEMLPVFVIVGEIDNKYDMGVRLIEGIQSELPVILLRNVDDHMLSYLYRAALFVVMASYAEGFGLPVVEAMSAGVPVIAGDNTAFPEVLGDCGILIDSKNSQAIADAYERMISDGQFRAECVSCGLNRVQEFSWKHAAEQYLLILDEIAHLNGI